jgi:hypothetical protein
MKNTLAAAVLTALALLLSACGGGGSETSSEDDTASKAISDSIMKAQKQGESSAQFFTMKRKDADCIGDGLVDEIGTEKLQEYGLLTEDNKTKKNVTGVKMSKTDAGSATDVLFECTDVQNMMQKAMNQAGNVPDEMKACVKKVLNEENLRGMFSKIFSGQQEQAQQELVQPMMECATGNAG